MATDHATRPDKGALATRLICSNRPDDKGGRTGIGTTHHVAWRVVDDRAQQGLRAELLECGYDVSEVLDRTYFRSIL